MKKITLLFVLLCSFVCFAKTVDYKNEKYDAMDKNKQYEAIISSIQENDESSYTISDYFYLGLANFRMGKDAEAKKYFNTVIQMDPEFYDAYDYLAGTYFFAEDYENAIVYLNKCKELDPKKVRPYEMLGVIYEGMGDYQKAYENYSKFYELDKSPDSAYAMAFVLYELKDYKKAKPYVEEYLKHDKDSFAMNNLMVVILYSTGDYKKAEKYEKKIVELWKNSDDEEIKNYQYINIYSFDYKGYDFAVYKKIEQSGEFYNSITCYQYKDGKLIRGINLEYDGYTAMLGYDVYYLGYDDVETNTHFTTTVSYKKMPKFDDFIKDVKLLIDGKIETVSSSTYK